MTTPPGPAVLLGDTFPAKAYLLVAHLSAAAPSVCAFAPDGRSFEIHDQGTFARDHLPRFYKHANYGSFVRQLNLYGFTSSRRKGNSGVVVWQHECFQRDRQDLVKNIQRTKRTKSSAKSLPPEVRRPSPSLSDHERSWPHPGATRPADAERGWWEAEFAKIAAQHQCLATQLSAQSARIAEQSARLETKLECLLQLTLRISPASTCEERAAPRAKRRRASPVLSHAPVRRHALDPHSYESSQQESSLPPAAGQRHTPAHRPLRLVYENGKVCHDDYGIEKAIDNDEFGPALDRGRGVEQACDHYEMEMLEPVCQDQKIGDDDQCGIKQTIGNDEVEPAPQGGHGVEHVRDHYQMETLGVVREDQKTCDDMGNGNAPADDPYRIEQASCHADEASPSPTSRAVATQSERAMLGDSLTKFIDVMLSEEEPEQDLPEYGNSHETGVAPSTESSDEHLPSSDVPSLRECGDSDLVLDATLMEEALDTFAPESGDDADSDLLASNVAVADPVARSVSNDTPSRLITMANHAMDKTDGPQPVPSSSSEVPLLPSVDVEAGNLPVGVTLVAARAEIVQEGDVDPNAERHRRGERRDRRKVIYLLAFIALVLSAGVTYTAVWASRKADADEAKKVSRPPPPPGVRPCDRLGRCPLRKEDAPYAKDKNVTSGTAEVADDPSKELRSSHPKLPRLSHFRKQWKKERPDDSVSLFNATHNDIVSSFTLILDGTDFVCNAVSS